MRTETFIVAPGAKIPFSLLSTKDKRELKNVVSNPSEANIKRTERGHFASRFGQTKRVLWETRNGEPVRILSIIDENSETFK